MPPQSPQDIEQKVDVAFCRALSLSQHLKAMLVQIQNEATNTIESRHGLAPLRPLIKSRRKALRSSYESLLRQYAPASDKIVTAVSAFHGVTAEMIFPGTPTAVSLATRNDDLNLCLDSLQEAVTAMSPLVIEAHTILAEYRLDIIRLLMGEINRVAFYDFFASNSVLPDGAAIIDQVEADLNFFMDYHDPRRRQLAVQNAAGLPDLYAKCVEVSNSIEQTMSLLLRYFFQMVDYAGAKAKTTRQDGWLIALGVATLLVALLAIPDIRQWGYRTGCAISTAVQVAWSRVFQGSPQVHADVSAGNTSSPPAKKAKPAHGATHRTSAD